MMNQWNSLQKQGFNAYKYLKSMAIPSYKHVKQGILGIDTRMIYIQIVNNSSKFHLKSLKIKTIN